MKNNIILEHKFVEYIPNDLTYGMIYVSMEFATAAHKCCCGCGHEVITPFTPTDWKLIYDGQSITLNPSIGNWSFACQSHYLIIRNKVHWAAHMSRESINAGRKHDALMKNKYFDATYDEIVNEPVSAKSGEILRKGIWQRIKEWLL